MFRTPRASLILILILIIGLVFLGLLTAYYADLPQRVSQHETILLGQNRFVPGSQAAVRLVVRDSRDASPLPDAEIQVSLKPASGGPKVPLYSGRADSQGTAAIHFQVPADLEPDQILVVETRSSLGEDFIERPVTIARDYRILLTTDKPIYQPGQVIHLRALALSAFDLTPAIDQELEIAIADGKGNKVFRQSLSTSKFGVAATDFQLAGQVNTGPYKITVTLGNTTSEKTVNVEHYVLPKFAIELETDREFYLPGQQVAGRLQADYFFGKPVAEGEVVLQGYTFDVEQNQVFRLEGMTDRQGGFDFEFQLPDYLAGTELEGGQGRFYLQASLTDQAGHTEAANTSLPVAGSALIIDAIPEGGQFRPGVENILYVLTSYPDGTPAQSSLSLVMFENGQRLEAQSGPYGLAEIRLTPRDPWQSIQIEAQDLQGNQAVREFYFEGEYAEETVLLRPDKPLYRVGDSVRLSILASQPQGTVYLDILREGQTVSTRAVTLDGATAELAIDLSPDLYGTLTLNAYKILRSGSIVRDTRLVVVDPAQDLSLLLSPDREIYRPGDQAGLAIETLQPDGAGVQAAVGLAIVDESVFALAEQDPGFAKLYFLLEQEILRPRYDLHGFSVPELVLGLPTASAALQAAVEDAAQASLAALPSGAPFSLQANSHVDAIQRIQERQTDYFSGLSNALFGLILAIPLAALGLSLVALLRERRLAQSLALAVGFVSLAALIFLLWPADGAWWAGSPADRLGVLMDYLVYQAEPLLLGLAAAGILGYLTLTLHAILGKDGPLAWTLGLLPLFILVLGLLRFSLARSGLFPGEAPLLVGLLAYLTLPLALILRAAGYAWARRMFLALAALGVAGALVFTALPVVAMSPSALVPRFGDVVFEGEADMFGARLQGFGLGVGQPVEMPAEAIVEKAEDQASTSAQGEPPRLRQYFPETMLWLPDLVTDQNGQLEIDFPVADSITTWRLTALASTQDGQLGSATASLRVFQDFFIDLDLPLALTVGDEISIPVGVFNYLKEPQTVRLELAQESWFELLDQPTKTIDIAANDISVVYFRVRAVAFGRQPFQVTAWGSQMSDAIRKEIQVYPDGKPFTFSFSDRLTPEFPVREIVAFPAETIPGTQSLVVKIYPGVVSQVVEGLEGILRMPFGCFEQTSSTTYPNVLVLDYLQSTGQAAPETQFKAEEFINLGYQRLTTFEVGSSGGFSLFGDPPPDRMLTAYGLQEFSDMARVHPVDENLVQRAAEWLLDQQKGDGSWENDQGLVHENTWSNLQNDRLPVTAYVVWSLVEAGFGSDPRTQMGLAYVREFQAQAEDPYVVALVANALVAADLAAGKGLEAPTEAVLERLAGLAQMEGNSATWPSGVATFMGSEGRTGSIETTALAALVFLRADHNPQLANAALTALVQDKDSFGTWYSTQATVLALKALIESVRSGAEDVDSTVTVTLDGGQTRTVQVTPDNFDVVQLLSFDDLPTGRESKVEITVEGKGSLMYQVAGTYVLPWEKAPLYEEIGPQGELVNIQVDYDRTELAVEDTVQVDVTVTMNAPGGRAESALIDLGLPPGFRLLSEDLSALVAYYNDVPQDYPQPTIERFELTGRQILVYVQNLSHEHPLQFSYRLQARFPLAAQTPSSNAYDYYNPDVAGEAVPQTLVVTP